MDGQQSGLTGQGMPGERAYDPVHPVGERQPSLELRLCVHACTCVCVCLFIRSGWRKELSFQPTSISTPSREHPSPPALPSRDAKTCDDLQLQRTGAPRKGPGSWQPSQPAFEGLNLGGGGERRYGRLAGRLVGYGGQDQRSTGRVVR